MKILVLGSKARSLVNFRGAMMRDMVGAGHRVAAASPEAGDEAEEREVADALAAMRVRRLLVPMERSGTNPLRDLDLLRRLTALFEEERPELLFCYTLKPVIYGSLAAKRAGVPRIVPMITGLGRVFSHDSIKMRVLRRGLIPLYRRALDCAELVFVQNPDDRTELIGAGVLRPDAPVVRVYGSGVDTLQFGRQPLPDGPPVFLMVARLLPEKGVAEYLEAARRLKAARPEALCRLLGPWDSESPALRSAVEAAEREGVVDYLGAARDVRPHLAACTVFVLPSYREGTPRSALEAMSTGRAVITTDAPGSRETVEHGVNGLLVPPRDPEALAAAMMELVDEPVRVVRMGEEGRNRVERLFDVRLVNRVLLSAMKLVPGSLDSISVEARL